MTAMSAPRSASQTAATSPNADLASTRTAQVRIPGSARTYEVRDVLRGLGLRWDPQTHAWHGSLPSSQSALLGRQLGVRPQVVIPIEAFVPTEGGKAPDAPPGPPVGPRPPSLHRVPRDGSRTRLEARAAFPEATLDGSVPVRGRFSLQDITSGLPDDSREADERAAARHLTDLRGRVKAARAALAACPGGADAIRADWRKEAGLMARFGITQAMFREGVPSQLLEEQELGTTECVPIDWMVESQRRSEATFPGSVSER
jgi:hypothetical protein